ncbi:MAG: tRNA (adenosine(37)-N6)-threonylcarbamoyltransferase complex dimerization subunit type 1 TsaB [Candidatus Omnitrophota bacterium]
MNLLAIDTSTEMVSIAVMLKGRIVFDFNRCENYGASRLVVYLKDIFDKLSLKAKVFDAFVVGAGPGSFTGLRLSFAVIKAFSMAVNKPVISTGSFLSCAWQVKDKFRRLAVVSDARRGRIYAAAFKTGGDKVRREKKEALYTPLDFISKHKDYTFITCDRRLRDVLFAQEDAVDFYRKDIWPKARALLSLAGEEYKKGRFTPMDKLQPLYIYPDDCQVKAI